MNGLPDLTMILVIAAFVWIGLILLSLSALVSIRDTDLKGTERAVWVLIVLMAGPIGAIVWFVFSATPPEDASPAALAAAKARRDREPPQVMSAAQLRKAHQPDRQQ